MNRSFRSIAGLALAGLTVAALTACGSVTSDDNAASVNPAAPAEPDLTWVAPEGLEGSLTLYAANPQGLNDKLIEEFSAATGVTVDIFADTTGKITAKLDAEWENPQADVVYLASWSPAAAYAADGRLLDHTPQFADSVHPAWVGDGFTGRDGSALSLVVNTNVATQTPSDWADLAAPEFTDQVIMPDPRESGTARDLIAAMVADFGEDETWELFDSLFENGLVVQGANGPALDDVIAGSHAVVLGGVDYSAYSAIGKGESLEVVIPSSGTTVSPRPVFILESTQNPDAAKAFVDFMFSQQGQEASANANMIPAQPSVAPKAGNLALDEVPLLNVTTEQLAATGKDLLEVFVERYLS
ncbi:MAG: ABC transporter substrate-binding protein [Leucobacter sp.]|nr:ABC transporter substrate-binding protein [Leucobacter sp.]